MKRRNFLTTSITLGAGTVALANASGPGLSEKQPRYQNGRSPWPICLDTATIRPANLEEKVDIAIEAGYDAIEPWDGELAEYQANGGDLKQLGRKIKDNGLIIPSMIGLWGCLPENEELFQKSLVETRRRLQMAADIGCEFVQAIPNKVGENYDHKFVTSCYRRLLEIGLQDYNVNPALVFVKMFPLRTLGQAVAVAVDADHPQARVIPDVFHMYISEGGFEGMKALNGEMFAIFQFNDAPKDIPLQEMTDAHRVYPGDGMLPLPDILKDLKATGFRRCISLELYNPQYHKQDLLQVARVGLTKTLSVIEAAGV